MKSQEAENPLYTVKFWEEKAADRCCGIGIGQALVNYDEHCRRMVDKADEASATDLQKAHDVTEKLKKLLHDAKEKCKDRKLFGQKETLRAIAKYEEDIAEKERVIQRVREAAAHDDLHQRMSGLVGEADAGDKAARNRLEVMVPKMLEQTGKTPEQFFKVLLELGPAVLKISPGEVKQLKALYDKADVDGLIAAAKRYPEIEAFLVNGPIKLLHHRNEALEDHAGGRADAPIAQLLRDAKAGNAEARAHLQDLVTVLLKRAYPHPDEFFKLVENFGPALGWTATSHVMSLQDNFKAKNVDVFERLIGQAQPPLDKLLREGPLKILRGN